MSKIKIRKAEKADSKFLAEIILLSESTGSEVYTYKSMFPIDEFVLKNKLSVGLSNSEGEHPLSYQSYLIAEADGQQAGALSCYIEGKSGDSNHLITGALMTILDREILFEGLQKVNEHADLHITKTKDTMQIEHVAIKEEFRGQKILGLLLEEAEKKALSNKCPFGEIQVWNKNKTAIQAYKNYGYSVKMEKYSSKDSNFGRILMTKNFHNG